MKHKTFGILTIILVLNSFSCTQTTEVSRYTALKNWASSRLTAFKQKMSWFGDRHNARNTEDISQQRLSAQRDNEAERKQMWIELIAREATAHVKAANITLENHDCFTTIRDSITELYRDLPVAKLVENIHEKADKIANAYLSFLEDKDKRTEFQRKIGYIPHAEATLEWMQRKINKAPLLIATREDFNRIIGYSADPRASISWMKSRIRQAELWEKERAKDKEQIIAAPQAPPPYAQILTKQPASPVLPEQQAPQVPQSHVKQMYITLGVQEGFKDSTTLLSPYLPPNWRELQSFKELQNKLIETIQNTLSTNDPTALKRSAKALTVQTLNVSTIAAALTKKLVEERGRRVAQS